MNRNLATVICGLIAIVAPLSAHHSAAAEFDPDKKVRLEGTISKVEMINPHSWIYIDVKGSDGKVVTWGVEGGAPNAMFRHGFRKDAIPVGTEVTIEGFQAKNGSTNCSGGKLTLKKTGEVLSLSGSVDPGK
jgi:Family of unknown function (DUF6152)